MKFLIPPLLALFAFSCPAQADQLIETYNARLGTSDHFNSHGQRLTNTAAIIRQDRANFHKFGIRDPEDEWDSFFSSKANRAILERMLNNGSSSRAAYSAIVNGTPMIRIDIYRNFINVTIN